MSNGRKIPSGTERNRQNEADRRQGACAQPARGDRGWSRRAEVGEGRHARSRRDSRWRQSRKRELCHRQGKGMHRGGDALARNTPSRRDDGGGARLAREETQLRSRDTRHPRAASRAEAHTRQGGHRRDCAREGRRRLHAHQRRQDDDRRRMLSSLHAARHNQADRVLGDGHPRQACSRDRAQQHRRQASRCASRPQGDERDGDALPHGNA